MVTAEIVVVKGENRGAFVTVTGTVTIGRSEEADLTLLDTKASSFHSKVTRLESGIVILEDLDSTNGTYVNTERIEQTPLRSGDLIKIGRTIMVYRAEPAAVRLEDIELVEGGSTGGISSTTDRAETSSVALRAVRAGGAANRLEQLLLAAGSLEPAQAIQGILEQVRIGLAADRALYFARRPGGGGAGLGGSAVGEGAIRDAPVSAETLRAAFQGNVVDQGAAVAAPVYAKDQAIGAVYADGSESTTKRDLGILGAAAQMIGVVVALDRSRQLTMSTIEIVGLAQAQVQRALVEIEAVLNAGSEARISRRLDPRGVENLPELQTALVPGLKAMADPFLLQRGMDRLITFARTEARGPIRLVGDSRDGLTRLILRYASPNAANRAPELLDPAGVVGDLLRAQESLGTAQLAVARVLLLRAGGVLTASAEGDDLIFTVELQAVPK